MTPFNDALHAPILPSRFEKQLGMQEIFGYGESSATFADYLFLRYGRSTATG
jgi:hypothetical protein